MKTYCFDFDGVICYIDAEQYKDRTPIKQTIEIMRALIKDGNLVIIHTGRHINHLVDTKKWLDKYRVKYTHIQFGKPVADVYIDDKALRIEGIWNKEDLNQLL